MRFLVLTCLLTYFNSVHSDCNVDLMERPAHKLKFDLLCVYDAALRPVAHPKNATSVHIQLYLKYFEYDHDLNSITISSWVVINWVDQHLKWKPSDYKDIKSIHLASSDIWTPDLSIFNMRDHSNSPGVVDSVNCLVIYNGVISCVISDRTDALCAANVERYPFDKQNCTLKMGSWVHTGEELNLIIPSKAAVNIEDLTPNGEWDLLETKAVKFVDKNHKNNTFPSIHYNFLLERRYGAHTATVLIPAIVILIITLTSLWLSPAIPERLTLCCVNLVTIFLYVGNTYWLVPLRGVKTPYLVLFGRDSLLLCAFTILWTVILKNLLTSTSPAPAWISTLVSCCLGCRPGQWLFLNDASAKGVASAKGEDDGETIISNEENTSKLPSAQDYIVFAKMLDRTCFILYCLIYFGMIIAYAP